MSKIAISNIAWSLDEEAVIAEMLSQKGLKYIEVAPTKYWDDPTMATDGEIDKVLNFWSKNGIEVIAFQSMLFGRENLKIFSDEENRKQTLEFLKAFIVLAGKMGVGIMVFGSPKNRQVGNMDKKQVNQIALEFFRELGETAKENNVLFCIEPNPTDYNCDFITRSNQGAKIAREINSEGIGLHLDLAGMTLAKDDIYKSIVESKDVLRHFHISSPFLGDVNEKSAIDHSSAYRALRDINYSGYLSIEMRPSSEGGNVRRIVESFEFIHKTYASL